jgi:hypothetical protein
MNSTPVLALALVACGGGMGGIAHTAERDSAGVPIVENRGDPALLAWRIDTLPRIDIGGAEGDSSQQLFRVAGVVRLQDGRVVVGDGGTSQLRFYDTDGRFLLSAGRKGDGPGEFRSIGSVFPYEGDSLLVTDDQLRRISIFDDRGAFGRSFAVQTSAELPFASVIGVFGDMTLLGQGFVQTGGVPPSGLQRYDNALYHLDEQATLITPLGNVSGSDVYYEPIGGGFRIVEALFGRDTHYRTAAGHFYIAPNDTYEIRRYRPGGTLDQIVRRVRKPRKVTDDDIAAEHARRLARAETDASRREAERLFDKLPHPSTWPAYGTMIVDDSLNLWVGDYVRGTNAPTTWTVFDSAGHMLGTVANPRGFVPSHIGQDFLLGRWRDELDVEHVRLHALTRSPALFAERQRRR